MNALLAITTVTTKSSARHLAEIAMIVGGLGALGIIVGGVIGLDVVPGGVRGERISYIAGGFLIGVCFLLFLLAIHNGYGAVTVR